MSSVKVRHPVMLLRKARGKCRSNLLGTADTCLGGGYLRVLIYYRDHRAEAGIEQSRPRCSSVQDFP